MSGILQWAAELEELSADMAGMEPAQIAAVLQKRQELLTKIQNADACDLGPETRRALKQRIDAVRQRDTKLLAAMKSNGIAALEKLNSVLHARSAARGYRGRRVRNKKDSRGVA